MFPLKWEKDRSYKTTLYFTFFISLKQILLPKNPRLKKIFKKQLFLFCKENDKNSAVSVTNINYQLGANVKSKRYFGHW